MRDKKETKVRYYGSYSDDFVGNSFSDLSIPKSYKWYHTNKAYRYFSSVIYGAATVFAFFYSKIALRLKVVGREKLKECGNGGFFLYGNHTMVLGDVFCPTLYAFPKRIFSAASPANLKIPVIGKIVPMLGGIVTPDSIKDTKQFYSAISAHIADGRCVVIYPEAHLWDYCTFIRPFPATSFKFPIMTDATTFSMTTTYQKRRIGSKPRVTVYIDGPFYKDESLSQKEAQTKLRDEVYAAMAERSKYSEYEYIRYEMEK